MSIFAPVLFRPYPFGIFVHFYSPDLGGTIGKKGLVNLNRDMKTISFYLFFLSSISTFHPFLL